jgi:hypothetical protein
MNYRIITASSLPELERAVNEQIKMFGCTPIGGPFDASDVSGHRYAQAVTTEA